MAESTSVALAAASIPNSADIARAEKFVRERFLHDGEDPAVALAPGTPRRRALDQALAELPSRPSTPRRPGGASSRCCSASNACSPRTSRSWPTGPCSRAHQVDALSGTLTALLAEAMRSSENGNGRATSASPELLASAAILGPDEWRRQRSAPRRSDPAEPAGGGLDVTGERTTRRRIRGRA